MCVCVPVLAASCVAKGVNVFQGHAAMRLLCLSFADAVISCQHKPEVAGRARDSDIKLRATDKVRQKSRRHVCAYTKGGKGCWEGSMVRSCCDIITQLFVSKGGPLQIKACFEVTSLKDEIKSPQAVSQTQDFQITESSFL